MHSARKEEKHRYRCARIRLKNTNVRRIFEHVKASLSVKRTTEEVTHVELGVECEILMAMLSDPRSLVDTMILSLKS